MTRKLSLAALMLGVALAGCGTPAPTPTPRFTPSTPGVAPTAAAPSQVIDLSHATEAPPVASDVTVALTPRLYGDTANPCAPVKLTTFVGQADPACSVQFAQLGANVVPGPDIVARSATPHTGFIQKDFDKTAGTSIATGFFVTEAIRVWAIGLGAPKIIPAMDGLSSNDDAINSILTAKKVKLAVVPQCVFPTRIRVANAGSDVVTYFESVGWAAPSTTAVVATYAKCEGIAVTFTDGTKTTLLGHTQTVSIVTTGHVALVAPFGYIFVQDGWGPCGTAALKSLCS